MAIEYDENGEPIEQPELWPLAPGYGTPNPRAEIPPGYELRNGVVSADLGHRGDPAPGPGRGIVVPLPGGNLLGRWSDNPDLEEALAWSMQSGQVDHAAQAIQAAMQFQAMRGYQNDLASGMAPAEALARNAAMFTGRGASGLGALAALKNASQVITPKVQTFQDAQGKTHTYLYNEHTGAVHFPPNNREAPASQQEKDLHSALQKARDANTKAKGAFEAFPPADIFSDVPTTKEKWEKVLGQAAQTARDLAAKEKDYADFMRTKTSTATPEVASPAPKPTMYAGPKMSADAENAMVQANRAGVDGVVRYVQGKPAIFDAKTKKFVRWVQ